MRAMSVISTRMRAAGERACCLRRSTLPEMEAAIHGQGVLLVSAEVVAQEVAAGRLEQVSPVGFRDGEYHLVRGTGVLRRRPVRAFHGWLRAECAPWRSTRDQTQPKG